MKNVRTLVSLACALCAAALAGGCGGSSSSDATLSVENRSSFSIVELHVVPVDSGDWGPNLLGNDSLDPGESLLLGLTCDTYDALLVDVDGVDCQLHGRDFCLNDADWIIRDDTCTSFGAARAAREAAARASGAGAASGSSGAATATTPDAATH